VILYEKRKTPFSGLENRSSKLHFTEILMPEFKAVVMLSSCGFSQGEEN